MRVLVHGAGAVGLGLGSALLAAGAEVAFVGRRATVEALRRDGLVRTGLFGTHRAKPGELAAATSPAELAALAEGAPGPADWALVCTKSYDSPAAARELAACPELVGPETRLVLCQNGWGNAEHFVPHFGDGRVWSARVITGFRRPTPGSVEITVHAEPVHVGSLFGRDPAVVAPLCEAVARGGIPCEPTRHVDRDLWAKLLYNGLLNPLGAIFDVPYGALAASPASRVVMADLAGEIFAVMHAAGHETHWPSAEAYLAEFHARLLPPTAAHESSTLVDLRAGRPTEIEAILGVVVRLGEAHGVATPVARTLLALVRFLEAQRGAPA